MPGTPEALFAGVRADDAARPVLTFYDDATGERAELSAASLGNWIAKTHFLLTDELGLGPGDRAYVGLPLHWLDPVVRLGVWAAGLEIVGDPSDAVVAFVDAPGVDSAQPAGNVYALALAPWGRGFAAGPPAGSLDFVDAVRPQADAWGSVRFPAGSADAAAPGRTRGQLIDAAVAMAAGLGWAPGARVLVTDPADRSADMTVVLAAWSLHGSVVLVRHAAADAAERLWVQESLTARAPATPSP